MKDPNILRIIAVTELKELKDVEAEFAHSEADSILCRFLRDLGYDDIVDAWDSVDKWYA